MSRGEQGRRSSEQRRQQQQQQQAAAAAPAAPSGPVDLTRLTPQEYLDRFSVTAYLKDVSTLLLENRPDEPLAFIADYFKNVIQGTSPLVRSYRYIRLTKRSRRAFWDNLVAAHATLDEKRGGGVGVTGAELRRLLSLLCSDFPSDTVAAVLAVLDKSESSVVSFAEFASGVHACLLYEEFFSVAEAVFRALAADASGQEASPRELGSLTVPLPLLHGALRTALLEEVRKGSVRGMPSWAELEGFVSAASADAHPSGEVGFREFLRHVFRLTSPDPAIQPHFGAPAASSAAASAAVPSSAAAPRQAPV
eukprot:TRINITY_DN21299_c2_g1_i1.p1 TRINITY_DN21299_c2_g1~~TRINITY_DN21299_c2_g1_i1.p1  ORF type:complete len:339 (+),score=119.24 TRINITY_DN21299_c2_g1_i1:94-1017(+)